MTTIRSWLRQAYEIASMTAGFFALYIIGYGYLFYARIGGFVAKLVNNKKIADKVEKGRKEQ